MVSRESSCGRGRRAQDRLLPPPPPPLLTLRAPPRIGKSAVGGERRYENLNEPLSNSFGCLYSRNLSSLARFVVGRQQQACLRRRVPPLEIVEEILFHRSPPFSPPLVHACIATLPSRSPPSLARNSNLSKIESFRRPVFLSTDLREPRIGPSWKRK